MNALTSMPAHGAETLDTGPVWSGRPDAWGVAKRVWRLPWVALWFALLALDGLRLAAAGPHAPPRAWEGEEHLLIVAAVTLAGLAVLSVLTARTTLYRIDEEALTMRFGLALQATLVIPFAAIEAVAARSHRDGTGEVALRLRPGRGVNYLKLWPHARPWRLLRPEPMLRSLPDAGVAAAILCRETARVHGFAARPASPVTRSGSGQAASPETARALD